MKNIFLLLIIILTYSEIKAEEKILTLDQKKIDSLELKVNYSQGKNDLEDILLISNYYLSKDINKVKVYSELGLKISKENNFNKYSHHFNYLIGRFYYTTSNNLETIYFYYNEALRLSDSLGDLELKYSINNNIAYVKLISGEQGQAYKLFKKNLYSYKQNNDSFNIARTYSSIGNMFRENRNFNKAVDNYLKGVSYLNNEYVANVLFSNMGITYSYIGDYKNAKVFLDSSYNYSADKNDIIGMANGKRKYGEHYFNMGLLDTAETITLEALKENIDFKITRQVSFCIKNLINIYQAKAKKELKLQSYYYQKIKEYAWQGIEICENNNQKEYYHEILNGIMKVYQYENNIDSAYFYQNKYLKEYKKTFGHSNINEILDIATQMESELTKENLRYKQKKEKEFIVYLAISGLVFLTLIILVIVIQNKKTTKLLLNVLPAKIAKRLKAKEHPIADHFENASIIFIDIVGFTTLSSGTDPKRIVSVLNDIFTKFDKLADEYGLEKIKTIGDAYMAVCGIPDENPNHVKQTALMALSVKQEMDNYNTSDGTEIKFRIGIDCGPVVAGVIGNRKFIYDLWSDAVNTASRMESTSESSKIQITENFKNELEKYNDDWNIEFRGEFDIKGKGLMKTYYLENKSLGE